jgi:AcrR family transcriptional regulator
MSTTPRARRSGTRRAATKAPRRRRLSPAERRGHLLGVAAELLTQNGVDGLQFTEVAARAGVTRQCVYRFFSSRRALVLAVLQDFADDLTARFGRGALASIPGSLDAATHIFVEAVCDTIEAKGTGPWHLLDSKGPDPEVARLGRKILDDLVAPWHSRISETIGVSEREAATLARMIVAAGRAALEQWYSGELTREEAARDTTRGVTALLQAFSHSHRRRR